MYQQCHNTLADVSELSLHCLKLTHIAYTDGTYWQIMLSNSGQGPSVRTLILLLHFARDVKERTLELGKDTSLVDTLRDMDCLFNKNGICDLLVSSYGKFRRSSRSLNLTDMHCVVRLSDGGF